MELVPGGGGILAGGIFRLSTRVGRHAKSAGDHRGLRRGAGEPGLPRGDGRYRRRAPVSPAAARGFKRHAPNPGRGSPPGLVVGEQALLERSRARLPWGVILRLQGFQPSAFAEDLKAKFAESPFY